MTPANRERDKWVQACLARLVAPTLTADGALGPRSHAALREFQRRVHEFAPNAPALAVDGAVGPATIAALEAATGTLAPGHAPKSQTMAEPAPNLQTMAVAREPAPNLQTMAVAREPAPNLQTMAVAREPAPNLQTMAVAREPAPNLQTMAVAREPAPAAPSQAIAGPAPVIVARTPPPGGGYVERRVGVRVYGTIGTGSPLLVPVAGTGGPKRLHVLAARAFERLAAAAQQDLGLGLKLASAWRAHRWESRAQYEAVLLAKYGSIAEGKRWLAFDSPHETGLSMDIGVGGLTPSRASVDSQRKTPLHHWLVARAWEFGWHPYKTEPWHWEYPISLAAYRSGQIAADDEGPPVDALAFGLEDEEEAVLEDSDLEELPAAEREDEGP